jgi:hypothetical protein
LPFLLLVCALGLSSVARGQSDSRAFSITPQIHKDFPFQTMWDEALAKAQLSRKPVLVFDLDLVDSASIRVANEVLTNKELRDIVSTRFEAALNDFAVDPPLSVGLDSLRHLGQRLSGLERGYRIGVRPTLLVIAPDSTEIDRIVYAGDLTGAQLAARLTEILAGINTYSSMIRDFWKDSTSIPKRQALIDKFEEHALYDSVLYHLESLRRVSDPEASRAAQVRYSLLRMNVEGNITPIRTLIASLGPHGADSALHFDALMQLNQFFQRKKVTDSVLAIYEELLAFTRQRDPSLLNDYAWYMAGHTKDLKKALRLVDEALRSSPNDPNFLDTRALVLAHEDRIDEAIATEDRALSLAPASEKAAFADSLASLKERKKAMSNASSPKKSKSRRSSRK